MRKIVADLFISLDGVIEDAGQWTRPATGHWLFLYSA
jgi:hypothetical protein